MSASTSDGRGAAGPGERLSDRSRDGEHRPKVSVVVPVLNAMPHLPRCVDALFAAKRYADIGIQIIFVDNGSTDGSRRYLRERCGADAMVLDLPVGQVGKVRNFGAARAEGEYLSFIDSDCVVSEDYFHRALTVLRRTGADATGSTYALPSDPTWVESVWFGLHGGTTEGWVNYVPGGNFVCSRSAFAAVDGFDPGLESGEDAELGQRLRTRGFRIFQAPSVRVVHLGNPKTVADHFGKQRWHGKGALGTARNELLDKPLLMTLGHAALLPVGLVLAIMLPAPAGIAAALAAWTVVPAVTVVYRAVRNRRIVDPVRATFLYWIYYAARGVSLAETAADLLAERVVDLMSWRRSAESG